MTQEEEKDFGEKVIRLSYKCAEELHISQEKLSSSVFIKWLVEKISKLDKEDSKDDKSHVNITI